MGKLIDADELFKYTNSYKSELGRLKADPFVKHGIETVEGFKNDIQPVKAIPVERLKDFKNEVMNMNSIAIIQRLDKLIEEVDQ